MGKMKYFFLVQDRLEMKPVYFIGRITKFVLDIFRSLNDLCVLYMFHAVS